jgi:hypothetical protein
MRGLTAKIAKAPRRNLEAAARRGKKIGLTTKLTKTTKRLIGVGEHRGEAARKGLITRSWLPAGIRWGLASRK